MVNDTFIIDDQVFKILSKNVGTDGITYELESCDAPVLCPKCHSDNFIGHGRPERRVRDLNEADKCVGLVIYGRRYRCKDCGNTWQEGYSVIDERSRMTNRMRNYIRNRALKKTFSEIAEDLSVSVTAVKQIFADYVTEMDNKRRLVAPKVLGLDETQLNKVYRGMYVDIENARLIDITADRKKDTVRRWLINLPEKERIECVTMDMWGPYQEVVEELLPDVPIVIDKFHVIKNLNAALEDIRRREQEKLTTNERKHAKKNKWLLESNEEDLQGMDKFLLQDLLYSFPQFKEPHQLKEEFRTLYHKAGDRQSAELMFEEWAEKAVKYPEYEIFVNTVNNWHEYIFNYYDHEYTNAATEGLNAITKMVEAKGHGYKFEVLRAKMLYSTEATKPAKFEYYTKKNTAYSSPSYPSGTYGFMDMVRTPVFEFSERRYKRIEVSSGVDIPELKRILEDTETF